MKNKSNYLPHLAVGAFLLTLFGTPVLAATDKEMAAEGIRSFGFKVFKALYESKQKEPVAISPMSLSEALTLATQGAESDTLTALENLWLSASQKAAGANASTLASGVSQLRQDLLTHSSNSFGSFQYSSANALWGNNNPQWNFSFTPTFLNAAQNDFDAELVEEDFSKPETVAHINDWVDNKTNGKITDLLSVLKKHDVAILLNAIHAEGTFNNHFRELSEAPYTNAVGVKTTATYMKKTEYLKFYEDRTLKAFTIPIGNPSLRLKDQAIALDILAPKSGRLKDLVSALDGSTYTQIVNKMREQEITLSIVAGKVEQTDALDLGSILTNKPFHVSRPFDAALAQFAPMGSTQEGMNIYLGQVLTKTFYEVTPLGFEAAAATAVKFAAAGASVTPIPAHVLNGPSVHVVRHIPTNTPLFISVYDSPQLYSENRIVELVESACKEGRSLQATVKNGVIQTHYDPATRSSSIVLVDASTGKVKRFYKKC